MGGFVPPIYSAQVFLAEATVRKLVVIPTFKEGKCVITHVNRFLNALIMNGKIDPVVSIALFGNSLEMANNYSWFMNPRATLPD